MSARRSRLARRLAGAALVATSAILAAGPAPAAAAPSGFFGVTPTITPDDADIQKMGQARVGALRMPFGWEELEPSPGTYNFTNTDRVVARAAEQGIPMRPFFFGTPPWARDCSGVPTPYCDRVDPLRSASGRERWPILMRTLVERYGPKGSFWSDQSDAYSPPFLPITEWQIWNEPNSATFFRPKPRPKAYFQLLKASSMAIRAVDPGARILLAGLFGTPPNGMTMWRFLDRLYGFKGAKKTFDAVAIHPYSPNIKGIEFQLKKAREVLADNGAKRASIHLTEVGWGSSSGKSTLFKGVKGQASLLKASFKFFLKNRKRYKIRAVDWFSWRDMAAGQAGDCILCESFGLLNVDHGAKPALSAYAAFTGGKP